MIVARSVDDVIKCDWLFHPAAASQKLLLFHNVKFSDLILETQICIIAVRSTHPSFSKILREFHPQLF